MQFVDFYRSNIFIKITHIENIHIYKENHIISYVHKQWKELFAPVSISTAIYYTYFNIKIFDWWTW